MKRKKWCSMVAELFLLATCFISPLLHAEKPAAESPLPATAQVEQANAEKMDGEQAAVSAEIDKPEEAAEQTAELPETTEPEEPAAEPAKVVEEEKTPEDAPPVVPQENRIQEAEEPDEATRALDSALTNLEKRVTEQSTEKTTSKVPVPEKKANEFIEFQFENTDLKNVIAQVGDLFDVSFITDDVIDPLPQIQGMKATKGFKISYRNHRPLAKKEAWNLFLTFLDIAGFALVSTSDATCYRIVSTESARKSALPAFIGVDLSQLPDNDQFIRYVYFVENSSIEVITKIVDALKSSAGVLVALSEVKAIVLTDKAYNVKMLMSVVKELDKATMPQEMAILKLHSADAEDVQKLYEALTKTEAETAPQRFPAARKAPTTLYFPENARVIAEPRTNSLILLGTREAIERIETFIKRSIDKDPEQPYSPLHTHHLKYANAATVAAIMNDMAKFGKETAAGKAGGVRSGNKYLGNLDFVPEPITNSLIIRGNYEDYLAAKEAIEKIDEQQPQVVIEVLLVGVTLNDTKTLGAQIRTKQPNFGGLLGGNIKFQTSGLFNQGIQENVDAHTGAERLLADLINLVKGAPIGNTVFTLGSDAFGVWGVLSILETISDTELISNPFMIAINKQPAEVTVGEKRRVVTSTVVSNTTESAYGEDEASLSVKITPQINSDGMILLDISVTLNQYLSGTTATNVAKSVRSVATKAMLANNEVLAIGGLIQNRAESATSKVPVLGDVPLIGWLWKNRSNVAAMGNLLVLISTHLLDVRSPQEATQYMKVHVDDYYNMLDNMVEEPDLHDPVYRWFFKSSPKDVQTIVDTHLLKKRAEAYPGYDKKLVDKKAEKAALVPVETPAEQQKEMQWYGKPGVAHKKKQHHSKRSKVSLENDKKSVHGESVG